MNAKQTGTDSPLTSKSTTKVYPYRFIIGVIYFLASTLAMLNMYSFISIQSNLLNIYTSNAFLINFSTTLFGYILSIPFTMLSNYLTDKHGLQKGFWIGSMCLLLSVGIRVFCKLGFIYILVG